MRYKIKAGSIVAKLYFRYGAMNASKTSLLLRVAYNYEESHQKVLIVKPLDDKKSEGNIQSRVGEERQVDITLAPEDNFKEVVENFLKEIPKIGCILIDEAQFLSRDQVNDAFDIVVNLNIPIIAYGLRTDFNTNVFAGSLRLLELSHSIEEMKTICRTGCGRKALFNGRVVDGKFVRTGEQVAIDGLGFEYLSLCGVCYTKHVGDIRG